MTTTTETPLFDASEAGALRCSRCRQPLPPPETWGQWLHHRRRTLGLTLDAIADITGSSVRAISRWETDENRPNAITRRALGDALGIPAEVSK